MPADAGGLLEPADAGGLLEPGVDPRGHKGPPRVLWLTPVPPGRRGGGGEIRQAYLLEALAKVAEVHLVCSRSVTDPEVREAVASLLELGVAERDFDARPKSLRRAQDLWLALLGLPREAAALSEVRRAMAQAVAATTAEVVVVEYAGLAPLVAHRRAGQRWVLTMHNLPSRMAAQQAEVAPGRRQAWLYRRDARASARAEARSLASYDLLIAVSADDAAVAEALSPGKGVAVVPNGVDTVRIAPTPLPGEPTVLFSGALYTGPNRDGIRWFCAEVWPLVLAEVPAASLAVVGSRPPPEVVALVGLPGVSVHPDVPEMAPYLASARVAVVPLRIGTGTRLKALEAMAAGRPVVGTTLGLGGLALTPGVHAAFADEPAAFAEAVVRALLDDVWAASLAAEGRKLVEERYDWGRIGEHFVEAVLGRS